MSVMLTEITPGLLRADKNVLGQIFSIKNIYLYRFCLYMIRNALTVFVYVKDSLNVIWDDHMQEICYIILAEPYAYNECLPSKVLLLAGTSVFSAFSVGCIFNLLLGVSTVGCWPFEFVTSSALVFSRGLHMYSWLCCEQISVPWQH